MKTPVAALRDESRWPPVLTILVVLLLLAALGGHVSVLPVWVFHLAAVVVLASMAAVVLTRRNPLWLRIERTIIMVLAVLYIGNTVAELADMIGAIALHPTGENAFSLLSSSVAIWIANILAFSLLYWQLDRGGPETRNGGASVRPDWVFPQPAVAEDLPPDWRPLFLDYFYLSYNTATAFTPADAMPLTRRAKMLMMVESMISLLTMVIVVARAISVIPD
jgi:hypothetical protein